MNAMRKRFIFLIVPAIILGLFNYAEGVEITAYDVDGVYNNPEVVTFGHQPMFYWEYDSQISSFTVKVSTSIDALNNNITYWKINTSTSAGINTENIGGNNFRSCISYNSDNTGISLSTATGTNYSWCVTVYATNASIDTSTGNFTTTQSEITLDKAKYDLQIDRNNPFNPAKNEKTEFRYIVKDTHRNIKLTIFTISGEYVITLDERLAKKNCLYTVTWDGYDDMGNIVSSGVYLVHLDVDEAKGLTKRVVVTKR